MKVNYDEKSDAMYIRFSDSPYYESDEVKDGIVLDYNKKGKVVAIEILDASKNLPAPKSQFYGINFEILKQKEKNQNKEENKSIFSIITSDLLCPFERVIF